MKAIPSGFTDPLSQGLRQADEDLDYINNDGPAPAECRLGADSDERETKDE